MDPAAPGSIRAGLPAGAVGVPMEAAAGADKMPAGAAAARAPVWTRVSALAVTWAGAAALYLLGCAEVGLALFAMILPAGKACAPTVADEVASLHSAAEYLVMGMSAQVIAFTMALVPPAWSVAVSGTVLGTLIAYYFPANDVIWLLFSCDGAPALHLWLIYVVVWPAFAIGAAVVCLKSEIEDQDRRRPSTSSP